MSLTALADLLEISYQQVQKYESGSSKIAADKLVYISHILNEPLEYFYKDIDISAIQIGEKVQHSVVSGFRQNKMKVLLVEDNPEDVIFFKRVAEKISYIGDVTVEHEANKAIDYLLNRHANPQHRLPDVIFLDLGVPGANGVEILKRIKSDQTLRHIAVVVLSGAVKWDDMMACYRHGAASYVLKSTRFEDHETRLKTVLDYWANHVSLPNM